MWNSTKVGEWIEQKSAKALSNNKHRGWEYLRRLQRHSPKVPRPPHKKADEREP
jgi:hypothetical protein